MSSDTTDRIMTTDPIMETINTSKYSSIVKMCLDAMHNINAICIGFDLTVLRMPSYYLWKLSSETLNDFISGRDLADDFADLELFKTLVAHARTRGKYVFVVSSGDRDLISTYLTFAGFTDVHVLISTPSSVGLEDGINPDERKNLQLQKIMEDYFIPPDKILFIDDDYENCQKASEIGIVKRFYVSRACFISSEFARMMNMLFDRNADLSFQVVQYRSFHDFDRVKTEEALKNQPPGKYVLRQAITRPFNVCVSYVNSIGNIDHVLISTTDDLLKITTDPFFSPI
jgi:hypothetical protein